MFAHLVSLPITDYYYSCLTNTDNPSNGFKADPYDWNFVNTYKKFDARIYSYIWVQRWVKLFKALCDSLRQLFLALFPACAKFPFLRVNVNLASSQALILLI